MDVEVDDGTTLDGALGAQPTDSDCHIVEHAKSFTMIGKRMMRAAGQIAGEPELERCARRAQSAACGEAGTQPQFMRPR